MTGSDDSKDNVSVEAPRVTTKQLVLAARGQELAVDYFLYSCLEQERLRRARKDKVAGHLWPLLPPVPAAPVDGEAPAAPSSAFLAAQEKIGQTSFADLVDYLVHWYRDNFPALADNFVLDHAQLNQVLEPIVAFNHDLSELYERKAHAALPPATSTGDGADLWTVIGAAVSKYFPTYKHFFLRYLQWTHAEEPKDDFEPGSRPPVGRYAPPMPRNERFGGGDRGGRGGPRSGGRGDRPPRPEGKGSGRPQQERPRRSGSTERYDERGPQGERAPRPGERPPQGERGSKHGGRRTHGNDSERRPRRDGRGNAEQTAALSAAALGDVDQAISQLNANSSLGEVVLKPANSFYRRIQHQKIIDAGFQSVSVGEGPDRAVKISRG